MSIALECRDVQKSFGTVRALDGASLCVERGTIHGLVGENGAGKTTLMKVVMGELTADSGHVDAVARPGLVRQQLSTIPEFSVLDNIIFGAPPLRRGLIDRRTAAAEVRSLMELIQLPLPIWAEAARLPLAFQQRMEIVRVLYHRAELIIMDEPTALLTPHETDALFGLLRRLAANGHAVVLITHKLREVEAVCDAVTVIRRGRTVHHWDSRPFSATEIAAAMVGGFDDVGVARATQAETSQVSDSSVVLSVDVDGTELAVRAGEVVGVAGVAGNGQEALVEHICGLAANAVFGRVAIGGTVVDRWTTRARREAGLRLIPADVRQWGSAVDATIMDNVVTAEVPPVFVGRFGRLRKRAMAQYAAEVVAAGQVVCSSIDQKAGELSGGNLQRLVVARELASGGQVVVAHEPTRGVDFRAAHAIRRRLREFADHGGAVLLVSSDLDELFEISDRIVVMYRGAVAGEVGQVDFTPARLGSLMGGINQREAWS